MRELVEKYPDGYEGYAKEHGLSDAMDSLKLKDDPQPADGPKQEDGLKPKESGS